MLGLELSRSVFHSENEEGINSILREPLRLFFSRLCTIKSVEGVEVANCSLENLFLCKLILLWKDVLCAKATMGGI